MRWETVDAWDVRERMMRTCGLEEYLDHLDLVPKGLEWSARMERVWLKEMVGDAE